MGGWRRVGPHGPQEVGFEGRRVGFRRVGQKGGRPKISHFFPLPPPFSFFSSLSGDPFVEFWWCLKRRSPQMCTFGVLGSCEAPVAPKPPGFHTTTRLVKGGKCFHHTCGHKQWVRLSCLPFLPDRLCIHHRNLRLLRGY